LDISNRCVALIIDNKNQIIAIGWKLIGCKNCLISYS